MLPVSVDAIWTDDGVPELELLVEEVVVTPTSPTLFDHPYFMHYGLMKPVIWM
jgi:hypothetical protein